MSSQAVKLLKRQRGASLVELLIASMLGLAAIGTVGSVFVTGQKLVAENAKSLMLVQNLSSAMQQIKEDAQRAGFDGIGSSSLMISGAANIVHTESDLIGYVYRVASSGTSALRHVVYKRESSAVSTQGDSLKICEKHSSTLLTVSAAATSGTGGNCFNLFDTKQISVTAFDFSTSQVEGSSSKSQWVTVSVDGHLVDDPTISYQASIQMMQRNWQ